MRAIVALAFTVLSAAPVHAQQFLRNTSQIPTSPPGGLEYVEQVDFADVDGDGDWDAAFACGGDIGNRQNHLWVNSGGAQGGALGTFLDATGTRFPAVLDTSRDIEFADWDADGDVDVFVSNESQFTNQPSRFWTNLGGAQGGAVGFYADETATRWIGLGGPGSSIAQSQVLAGGGYINWCRDSDFADIDNDGDLDLVHSSAGGGVSGQMPTRIFLNDGAGFFSEFNPSGFQLTGLNIANGNPGLWCEGIQQANTLNATGQFCDIANQVISIDPGDIDQDFDLDLVSTPQSELPRMYRNRLAETGALAFRDATTAVFPPGYSTGNGHYEETFGDFDGDLDFDLYGLNWLAGGFTFDDAFLRNNGDGTYTTPVVLNGSGPDDEDADAIDYDLDGDLDVFVSNFSGQERMYRNNGTGAFTLQATGAVLPADSTTTMDADSADLDEDGDPDVIAANSVNQAPWLLINTTMANEVTAPRFGPIEQAPDRAVGSDPTVVRVHVYDNSSYQETWYDEVRIEARVGTQPSTTRAMRSSMGQVFRGGIPGTLAGLVSYRVTATDHAGNSATSGVRVYAAGVNGTGFCFGEAGACPCGNDAAPGSRSGCLDAFGVGVRLVASGTSSVSGDGLVLAAGPMPDVPCMFFQGTAQVNGGLGSAFGDGLRCAGGTVSRLGIKTAGNGVAAYPEAGDAPISLKGMVPPGGGTRSYQLYYRSAAPFCTADSFNLTNGWTVTWTP